MTRQERRQRNHERRQEQRRQWERRNPMRCAHCGHTHGTRRQPIDVDMCPNCQCRDFDF